MSLQKPKTPVIVLAYANERTQEGFLRKLTLELKSILTALEPAVQKGRVHVKVIPAASQEEIAAVFQDEWYENRVWIFHYGGHASKDQLWLEDEKGDNQPIFATGLAGFLGAQQGLKLVFLNACATQAHAELMMQNEVASVVATSEKINDEVATQFAKHFYMGLAAGSSIEEAYQEASSLVLGRHHIDTLIADGSTRSLYWEKSEEEEAEAAAQLPWQLFPRDDGTENTFFPRRWRLFHELKEGPDRESIAAKAFLNEKINNYEIVKILGEGSMGIVYKANHVNLNEERAVRITHHVSKGYEYFKDMVYAGNKGLGTLNHPNIVKFYDVGEVVLFGQKRLYMIMELIKGKPMNKLSQTELAAMLQEMKGFISIMTDLLTGLEAAHKTSFVDASGMARTGIVHGNIKLSKIFLGDKKVPKLNDFMFTDLARSSNIALDAPESIEAADKQEDPRHFFPPEVLAGQAPVNKQSDIYAMGCVMFKLLIGLESKPMIEFDFKTVDQLHRFVKERHSGIPKNLSKTIFRATRPQPSERYQSVGEMIEDLLVNTSFWKRILYWFKRK